MKSPLLTMMVGLSLSSSAWATGGLICQSHEQDKNLDLLLSGGLSHTIPGSPFQVGGALIIKSKDLAAHGIPNIDSLSQFWFEGGQLNLLVYREPPVGEEFLSTTLIIKTRHSKRQGRYLGQYTLIAQQGDQSRTLKGSVTCELD